MAASSSTVAPFSIDPALLADLETITRISPVNRDDFAVVNGVLRITEGGIFQSLIRTWQDNLGAGGHNISAVIDHLQTLRTRAWQAFGNLDSLLEDPVAFEQLHYPELKRHKRRIKAVASKIMDLCCRSIQNARTVRVDDMQKLVKIHYAFSHLKDHIKAFLSAHRIPFSLEPKPFDVHEPLRNRHLLTKMPKGATPQDIATLFRSAVLQNPDYLEEEFRAVSNRDILLLSAIPGMVALPLSILKCFSWNIIELINKGYVASRSPVEWVCGEAYEWLNQKNYETATKSLLYSYMKVLLNVPLVTDQHVETFCELAEGYHFGEVCRYGLFNHEELISNNVAELMPLVSEVYRLPDVDFNSLGPQALKVLSQLMEWTTYGFMTVDNFSAYVVRHFNFLKWIDTPEWVGSPLANPFARVQSEFSGNTLEERRTYFLSHSDPMQNKPHRKKHAYINFQQMRRIIDLAGVNPTWTHFRLRRDYLPLKERLQHWGFVEFSDPNNPSTKVYRRAIEFAIGQGIVCAARKFVL